MVVVSLFHQMRWISFILLFVGLISRVEAADVEAVLRGLSLSQKIGQMTLTENIGKVNELYSRGFGQGATFDLFTRSCRDTVAHIKNLNQRSMAFSGAPVFFGSDVIHGAGFLDDSTLFPHVIGIAATFNTSAVVEVAHVIALESRVCGISVTFGPPGDLGVDYRWGRHYETFGDDPVLVSAMVDAYVRGSQRPIPWVQNSTIMTLAACVKHWIGYSMPTGGTDREDAKISPWLMERFFVPPFRAAVAAGSVSMMLNSGTVNGLPSTSNKYHINEMLRVRLGWGDGMMMTDWQGASYIVGRGWGKNVPEVTRQIVEAGVDMSMNPEDFADVVKSFTPERITPTRLNASARRILNLKNRLGLWEYPNGFESRISQYFGTDANRLLALRTVEESVVMLKNRNDVLPLPKDIGGLRVLVTGPAANSRRALCGAWTYRWQGADDDNLIKHKGKTIFEGLRDRLQAKGAAVNYVPGCFTFDDCGGTAAAVEAARNSDYIVIALGERPYAEGAYNIDNLELQGSQLNLVRSVGQLGKKIVVVFVQGRPRTFEPVDQHIDAILYAFLPGPEGGTAIANIVAGDTAPNGRLPFAYPTKSDQIGLPLAKHNAPVKYPFGFGLSFTTFEYSGMSLSPSALQLSPNSELKVSINVANVGSFPAKEVVLLYLEEPTQLPGEDLHTAFVLKKFKKVFLGPKELINVTFILRGPDWRFLLNGSLPLSSQTLRVRIGWDNMGPNLTQIIAVTTDSGSGSVPFDAPDIPGDEAQLSAAVLHPPIAPPQAAVDPPIEPPTAEPIEEPAPTAAAIPSQNPPVSSPFVVVEPRSPIALPVERPVSSTAREIVVFSAMLAFLFSVFCLFV